MCRGPFKRLTPSEIVMTAWSILPPTKRMSTVVALSDKGECFLTGASVQCRLIRLDIVHPLEDVDFACKGWELREVSETNFVTTGARVSWNLPSLGQSAPTSHTAGQVLPSRQHDAPQIRRSNGSDTHAQPCGM